MNGVLIQRITGNVAPLVAGIPGTFSLAQPIDLPLDHRGRVSRQALKTAIGCQLLGMIELVYDGIALAIWFHNDADDEGPMREVACEITDPGCADVVGVLEGPLVITGALASDGILPVQGDILQELIDFVNAGRYLRTRSGEAFTFDDLLPTADIQE